MRNILILAVALAVVVGLVFAINQFFILRKAHSTFEDYYAFRGCAQLVKRTGTYGICKLSSGKEIKIVEFHNKWYLDGDLPFCFSNICF